MGSMSFMNTSGTIPNKCSFLPLQVRNGKRKLKGKGKPSRRRSARTSGSRQPCYAER